MNLQNDSGMFYSRWWIYQEVYLKTLRARRLNKYLHQVHDRSKPLFIHINKTAGSSIARSLGITEAHHTLREYEELYRKKFNEDIPDDIEIWTSVRNPFDKISSEYYYRIMRNYNKLGTNTIPFDEWVKRTYADKEPFYRDREIMFMSQSKWIESSKNYKVNLIRFENLNSDYKKVAEKYNGIPLVWKKKSDNKNYKDTFSEASKAIISEEFEEDLDRFNYSFE